MKYAIATAKTLALAASLGVAAFLLLLLLLMQAVIILWFTALMGITAGP
jgi:hypothetical protein